MNDNSTPNNVSERRHERRGGGEWILGIILILLAGFLYLQNMKIYTLNNWWALFILLPALGAFNDAWRHAREAGGRFTMRARGAVIFGLVLLAVTAMFLFSLNWTILGPILLALAGVGMIVNAMFKD
jgi:hypothetical protein